MIKEFVALGPTMNIYLANDLCVVQKKATSKKKCVINQEIKFERYKECFKNKRRY